MFSSQFYFLFLGIFLFPSLLPVRLTQFNFTCLVFHTCSLSTNCPPVSVNHPLQCTCLDSSFPLFFARWSCSHCQVVRHFQVWFLVSSFPSLCIFIALDSLLSFIYMFNGLLPFACSPCGSCASLLYFFISAYLLANYLDSGLLLSLFVPLHSLNLSAIYSSKYPRYLFLVRVETVKVGFQRQYSCGQKFVSPPHGHEFHGILGM